MGRPKAIALLIAVSAAACLLCHPPTVLAEGSALSAELDLAYQQAGEPAKSLRVLATYQGGKGLFHVLKPGQSGPEQGGYLFSPNQGESWYWYDPIKHSCLSWTMADLGLVLGSLISKLKSWADLTVAEASLVKIDQKPGPRMLGYSTTYYKYQAEFVFKASFLFKSWRYKIKRLIEVWATEDLGQYVQGHWLGKVTLSTGHAGFDQILNERLEAARGVMLKEQVVQSVVDKDGKETKSSMSALVTKIGRCEPPAIFVSRANAPACKQISKDELTDHVKFLLEP